jgi:hypothetical protein
MSDEPQVLCSPSKVNDFAEYFCYYPERPLKIDLLAWIIHER